MSIVFFAFLVVLSTAAGYAIARIAPWRSGAHFQHLAWPLGLVLGPFLLGICVILALYATGGTSPRFQVMLAAGGLAAISASLLLVKCTWRGETAKRVERDWTRWLLMGLFGLCVLDVMFLAIRLPLTENDALEYGLVGRAIYEARSLSVYPLLDTNAAESGFFAPWTHPPLYPSLIHAAYAVQGSAATAGLMKLIAPWFLLTATAGVIGLGKMQGVRTGWLAGLLFIGIPLLAIGAETAAIDPLPVAGMVLLLLGLVGLDRERATTPLLLGLLVGLALWSHSQAILYLPIMACAIVVTGGLQHWARSVRIVGLASVVALVVAGYPYLRNIAIYGTPISDNPAVFVLPSLDWIGFFKYTRSIYDWGTRLQYGLLKGLVAVHNYGFVFWMGVLALLQLAASGVFKRWFRDIGQMRSMEHGDGPVLVSFAVVLIYHAGVLTSMLIGLDLMIKNDRYLLVMAAPVSILAAVAAARIAPLAACSRATRLPRLTELGIGAAACILFLGHAVAFLLYGNLTQWLQLLDVRRVNPSSPVQVSFRVEPLEIWHGIQIAQELHKTMTPENRVLAIRPADMYYAERRMVSYLDPIMVPLYGLANARDMQAQLRAAGIRYIQAPPYFIPPVTHSPLMNLLADPGLTSLVRDLQFSQLYQLRDPDERRTSAADETVTDLSAWPWVEYPRIGIGGPAFALRSSFSRMVQLPHAAASRSSLLAKSYSHILEVGDAGPVAGITAAGASRIQVMAGKEYVIDLDVEGEGFNRVHVWMRATDSDLWSGPYLAGDFVLSPQVSSLRFLRRLRIPEQGGDLQIRIGIERYGISRLTLRQALLKRLPD